MDDPWSLVVRRSKSVRIRRFFRGVLIRFPIVFRLRDHVRDLPPRLLVTPSLQVVEPEVRRNK